MPRPKRCRRVHGYPRCASFAPDEGESRDYIILSLDEYETIRLLDYEGQTQSQCADAMGVSRTTVTDIYDKARHKLADCLVNGKKLVIAGGSYRIDGTENQFSQKFSQKGKNTMRIAVAYEPNGEIFQHFGRTEAFKIYEINNGSVDTIGMLPSGDAGHGALTGLLKAADVDALICGGIGGGARMALAEEGIALYAGVSGSADEAVESLSKGTLEAQSTASCSQHGESHECGHHGHGTHGNEGRHGHHHGESHHCGHHSARE